MAEPVYALIAVSNEAEYTDHVLDLFATQAGAEAERVRRLRVLYEDTIHPERAENGHYMERLARTHVEVHARLAAHAARVSAAGFDVYVREDEAFRVQAWAVRDA